MKEAAFSCVLRLLRSEIKRSVVASCVQISEYARKIDNQIFAALRGKVRGEFGRVSQFGSSLFVQGFLNVCVIDI